MTIDVIFAALILSLLSAPLPALQVRPHASHGAAADERGDRVMGFDHTKTTHHFLLAPDGGTIEISANDPADGGSRDRIRSHLAHIAGMFAEGNFEAPMLIHGEVPPGVPVMKKQKSRIRYEFQATDAGGKITISTKSPAARRAVHEFLRYQIREHRTGD
jgi:hypothetical protein